ncbi:Ferredoxin [Zostera marina]|uniref:Ferredoxin n=1 Tax=Zostera marina TaxID=29655 RepID=A0A0K9Q1Y7_ZOSMR|nr:Ferredoxin [Zostera marina]
MAMASSSIRRIPISFLSRTLTRTTTTTTAEAVTGRSSSAKVSDRMVRISAIASSGQKHEVIGLSGQTLLRALTNAGLIDPASHRLEDIEACSAECEVSIAEEFLNMLPPRSEEEEYLLKRNSRVRIFNKHSRLGCQVVLTQEHQGMVVAVPEPKPWDTP